VGTLLVIALQLALAVAASAAGMLLVRRVVTAERLQQNHEVVGTLVQVSATAYAVLLAFAVVIVWQAQNSANSFAEREANQVYDLYRLADAFPDAQRIPLQGQLQDYARTVVEEEWPLLADGKASDHARAIMSEVWWAYTGEARQFDRENPAYPQSLEKMSALNDARRERVLAAGRSVPAEVWFILIAGAFITVAMTWFFGARHLLGQVLLTAGLVLIIGCGVLVVRSLENPFDGENGLEPTAFRHVLDRMAEDQQRFHR
jgi:hypothetical protein